MPYGHQIWKNPLPERNALLGSKVMKGSAGVNLLYNALWPPNLVGRTHDQRVMRCWGQRSCTSQPESTRGQIPYKCYVATKIGRKDPRPECNVLMGSKVLQG